MTRGNTYSGNNFADRQTLTDLQIFGDGRNPSVFEYFNRRVESYGGRNKLREIFLNPPGTYREIARRIELIDYIHRHGLAFEIRREVLDFIETYLAIADQPVRPTLLNKFHIWATRLYKHANRNYIIRRSVLLLFEVINHLRRFAIGNEKSPVGQLREYSSRILQITDSDKLFRDITGKKTDRLSLGRTIEYDSLFRYSKRHCVRELLDIVYMLDVCNAASEVLKQNGFRLPTLTNEQSPPVISIEGLHHPFVSEPVENDIRLDGDLPLTLITGANMSGKSTFMKAFGIAVYLSHLGLPVPASRMICSKFDGIFTTINLPDDMASGYSHFYAEVKRVKTIAESLHKGNKLVVIFDELFRGTNVRDAAEGSLAIIKRLAGCVGSVFLVTTHLTEIVDDLGRTTGISYLSFRTLKNKERFENDYKLRPGVSKERYGIDIIGGEGILDLIENARKS